MILANEIVNGIQRRDFFFKLKQLLNINIDKSNTKASRVLSPYPHALLFLGACVSRHLILTQP